MRPILFETNERNYNSNGIGTITDAGSCVVTEGDDTRFELEMTVPITSRHFSDLLPRRQILAKPNPYDRPQPFRISRITKPLHGLVTVFAEHISYDLTGIPVPPFSSENAEDAVSKINLLALTDRGFELSATLTATGTLNVKVPVACRNLLGSNGIQGVYGGEYKFDRYNIQLLTHRGENRGFKILYGKNLVDLEQEQNIADMFTGVLPYWSSNDDTVMGDVQSAPGTFDFSRVKVLDVTKQFRDRPGITAVNEAGAAWVAENNIGVPKVSLKVSFIPPGSVGIQSLNEVQLGDTVLVRYDKLGVETEATIIQTKYDVLRDRYIEVQIGDRRVSIAQTIAAIAGQVAEAPTLTAMEQAIKNATDLITGATGGSVVWGFDATTGLPNELYFLDTENVETAVHVLRINRNGIGFSSQGVSGPFDTAWTIDGSFYAKWIYAKSITTGKLDDLSVTNAKIANATIQNPKIYPNTITTGSTSSGINTSLGYADYSNQIFSNSATASYVRVLTLVDTNGNMYRPRTIYFKDHSGTNVQATVWANYNG